MSQIALISLLLAAPSTLAQQAACPDLSTALDLPPFPEVEEESFNNILNNALALTNPFHMVNDEVIRTGGNVTINAKFDYTNLIHKDLEGEDVYTFLSGPGIDGWESLGVFTTNGDGRIYVPVTPPSVGDYAFYAVVAGDLSSALGYISVFEDTAIDAVLFDIDATLTTSDFEAVFDYLGIRDATAQTAAADTVNAYLDLNYRVFFLTNRPYWQAVDTRMWLADTQSLPPYHVRHNFDFLGDDPVGHKSSYITEIQAQGVNLIRVYGNADTDIEAYELAGIPKEDTYIIGELAGEEDTQPITGDGYVEHLATVVANTPPANCIENGDDDTSDNGASSAEAAEAEEEGENLGTTQDESGASRRFTSGFSTAILLAASSSVAFRTL